VSAEIAVNDIEYMQIALIVTKTDFLNFLHFTLHVSSFCVSVLIIISNYYHYPFAIAASGVSVEITVNGD